MILPAFLLPRSVADGIEEKGGPWGSLDLLTDPNEGLLVVDGWRNKEVYGGKASDGHYTEAWSSVSGSGWWYSVKPELHDLARFRTLRGGVVTVEEIVANVLGGWHQPSSDAPTYVITVVRHDNRAPEWYGWRIVGKKAMQILVDIVDVKADLLAPLDRGWPRHKIRGAQVAVVGVGSIGSAACEALASYGIREFTLIDHDRLLAHNFARHRVRRKEHGRLKVNAVADLLTERNPNVAVRKMPLDVIKNADEIRPILNECDFILACPDGTRPRRMSSHLAYWAHKPVVLACVLEQGAFGEVLRLVPGRTGCLLCNRSALEDSFDPEPGLDAGYEAMNPHLPMTAVTGDLGLVGQLSAKAVVASILERAGERSQRLAGDHAVMALRPAPDFPPPFDFSTAGEVRWMPTAPARDDCPTCGEGP